MGTCECYDWCLALHLERARATPAATDESFFAIELKDGLDMYGAKVSFIRFSNKLRFRSGRNRRFKTASVSKKVKGPPLINSPDWPTISRHVETNFQLEL